MKQRDKILRSLAETATPEEAATLLESLRWREDTVITNHEGDRVWLRVAHDTNGNRIGITDCCCADNPCEYHARLVKP